MARHACFPGSFDPLTVAHVAVADAARAQCALTGMDLILSHAPLGKDASEQAPLADRLARIAASISDREWLAARATSQRLLADIASGYDLLVIGADKWAQLHDPAFYGGSESAMRDAIGRLPSVAIAPRGGHETPVGEDVVILDVDVDHLHVSSSAVRDGRHDWRA